MPRLRTANLLGALAGEVSERLDRLLTHPNQTDTSAAALALMSCYEGLSNAELAAGLGLSHPASGEGHFVRHLARFAALLGRGATMPPRAHARARPGAPDRSLLGTPFRRIAGRCALHWPYRP